jgi:UDP:flavonoid glycosyltransferase YjiC (YdhE family)
MKLVVGTNGSRGDVQPMVVLAKALQQAGHEVVVAAPEDAASLVQGHGVAYRRLCGPFEAMMPSGQEGFGKLLQDLKHMVAQQLETFPEIARGAELIVSGSGLFCGPAVAESLGIPFRSIVYCPRTLPSAHHPSVSFTGSGSPRWLNRLLWWLNDVSMQKIMGAPLAAFHTRHGLSGKFSAYRDLMTDRPILAADPLLAPLPADLVSSTQQVGAFYLDDPQPLPAELEAFLVRGEPPVYIGFGSAKTEDPARTTRLFLEAVKRAGVRAVLSRGWAGLGAGELPEDVLAIGPVSHSALLPRMRAMVHHGGAGTTHAAARAGIPQVIVPHLFDQFYWGPRAQALGVAPAPIPKSKLEAERLAEALRWCLRPESQQRAREVAAQLRTDGARRTVELLTASAEPRRLAATG